MNNMQSPDEIQQSMDEEMMSPEEIQWYANMDQIAEDAAKEIADAIDEMVMEELKELFRKEKVEEAYDRAMRGL